MESLELDSAAEIIKSSNVSEPKVSVVFPCYNDAKYLEESLDSILGQTFSEFELIVLDNGSVDNSQAILSKYKDERLSVYKSPINISAGKGLAFLCEKSKGKFIKVFCADDKLNDNCLSDLYGEAERSGATIICSHMNTMNENSVINKGDLLGDHDVGSAAKFFLHSLTARNPVCFPSVMVERSEIRASDFDFRFASLFDLNIWCQILAREGTSMSIVRKPLVNYR